jgi:transcriptional regulator with XRE-family HTH domain
MEGQLIVRLGRKIRETRVRQQMKLHEVAEAAGVSKGLLSRIENGRTVPSLSVLILIIQALRVPIQSFFEGIDAVPEAPWVHKPASGYTTFRKESSLGFFHEHILSHSLPNVAMEASILTLEPGSARKPVTTEAYEFRYMLRGEVQYQLNGDTVVLQEGDTLLFNGKMPHLPLNCTDKPASMLAIQLLIPAV